MNLDKLESMSIYDLADECYTSRSTVQRFIKYIGYGSFNNIKSKTQMCIDHNHRYAKYYTRKNFRENYLSELEEMMKSIDSIIDSPTIAPLDFQEAMLCFKKTVRCITNSSRSIELLNSLNENDTLITLSVTGNYALASLKDIVKTRANKVLITLNRSDEFKNVYDKIIYLNQNSASASFIQTDVKNSYTLYGLTYFLDLVVSMYYEKYYREK